MAPEDDAAYGFHLKLIHLTDLGVGETLYDVPYMRSFARLTLFDEPKLDEATILKFWGLLLKHWLTAALLNVINDTPEQRGLLLYGAMMIEATIIHASPSTQKEAAKLNPEKHQNKKGSWRFSRIEIQVGTDAN